MLSRILFAAGGTGGHIYPAIAVADELKKMNNKIEIRFIGATGRIEEKIVPASGYELMTIDVRGFQRNISPKNIAIVTKFLKAARESKRYLKEFKPEIVFGTGGFVSGPVLWQSSKLGITSVIQEGNSYPGVTVKWLSPKMNKVILNFESTAKYLKRQDNIAIMPYPVRQNLIKYSKPEALKYFGLDESKKTLFVFGGSQGARSINSEILNSLESFTKNNIQIIWQTGGPDFEKVSAVVSGHKNVKALQYVNNIDYAYSAADLIVCRSGISTLMELASFGSAVIFVPFAGATENHQEINARAFAGKDAAVLVLDSELGAKLKDTVVNLINDESRLSALRNNITQFADKDAAKKIALMLQDMVNSPVN